uniref:Ubiquitin carboxyl-terminal hydrolase n=1 Tax=Polytomella parva TaxID=51329 RepID=A0A7S0VLR0_9CHLO|mmetsp:Transcript_9021/g.17002  ORF Transcript_9021/g.17002 Transcript_9021/m.17002 type:complete len:411 (+) Transcript_9021:125-1357(+)
MINSDSWTSIESDPGVFTELVQRFGVSGVQFEELYSLDQDSIESLKPIHGLIFLFKWNPEKDTRPIAYDAPGVFFAQQIIKDACATQAILSILLNCPQINLGQSLSAFKEFTNDFPPDLKGEAIGNSDEIRAAHNSFSRPELLLHDKDDDRNRFGREDAFHFVAYVPINGVLYELDGLKPGPIAISEYQGFGSKSNWLDKARPEIQARMSRYSGSEIRFNLMALIDDRVMAFRRRIQICEAALQGVSDRAACKSNDKILESKCESEGEDAVTPSKKRILEDEEDEGGGKVGRGRCEEIGSAAEEGERQSEDVRPSEREDRIIKESEHMNDIYIAPTTREALLTEIWRLKESLTQEENRQKQWRIENERRRHNYIPFIFNLLKEMANDGKLKPLIKKAREVQSTSQIGFKF